MASESPFGTANYDAFDPGAEVTPEQTKLKTAYLQKNILPLVSDLKKDARILEIGPGHGALLFTLKEHGFTALEAFEVCEPYAQNLQKKGFQVFCGASASQFLKDATQKYDAVILVDVLEHLTREDAYALVQACCDKMSTAGRVIVQVPNASGLFGMNTFCADFTHQTALNEHGLRSLFCAVGFRNVTFLPLALPDGLGNSVRTLLRYFVFAFVKLLTRIVGATPVEVLTHNVIAVARHS